MHHDDRVVYSTEYGQTNKRSSSKKTRRASASSAPPIHNIAKQGVRIRREIKGRGGKTVCIIEGLSCNDIDMKSLMKRLKKILGTGGAVKGRCLEIQGNHRDKLMELLQKEGIKAKLAGG